MEKRIDPNDTPLQTASTNPAYIPGFTPAAPAAPAASDKTDTPDPSDAPGDGGDDEQPTAAPETAVEPADETEEGADESGAGAEADDAGEGADETGDGVGDAESDDDGAAFEAVDRRGSITVDRDGVRLRLDDQEAEFDWDEIGAVEHSTARFGRRFTVIVHTTAKRSYPAEVEAPNRATLKEWPARLDAALDAYFED